MGEGEKQKLPWVGRLREMAQFAEESIVSRTLVDLPQAKVVLFSMAEGQFLSEHTASVPASMHVVDGTATISLGDDAHEAGPGSYFFMPAGLPHSVHANENLTLLVVLFKSGESGESGKSG